eukprot:TRINITY_DN3734_c0_g1_i2.p1 TRINITY_DN3734_c0_g1~~TRINITY_DN3734_c0_g1_i2.p1  ORF type:complete len:495 (-),score=134.31 TRINITY_DN3734_c0_g1_i2:1-1305(-)
MDVRVESKARDSDSSSDEAPVIEVNIEDEEHQAYAERMKRAKDRNAARWREIDVNGQAVVKLEEENHGPDLSPPRARDLSPPRARRGDSEVRVKTEDDLSPPRGRPSSSRVKREPGIDDDVSPPRRSAGGDISPPRRSTGGDISPPRRSTGGDISPPRRSTGGDISPPRRSTGGDMSPPRRSGGGDMSPPRRSGGGDMSPPRRSRSGADVADLSPKRKQPESSSTKDLSPVRKKFRQMEGGGRAGLFLGDEVAKDEEIQRKRTLENLRKLDPKSSGQGAATIYRDRRGKVLSGLTQMIAQEEGTKYEDASTEFDWGVGKIDRAKEAEQKALEEEESGRGFHAVYADDERLNDHKKEQDRFGDPMLKMVKESSQKKKTTLRLYKGWIPSNRYGIRPGWRWDGIDRSNKFEERLFKLKNQQEDDREREMYYAQSDM